MKKKCNLILLVPGENNFTAHLLLGLHISVCDDDDNDDDDDKIMSGARYFLIITVLSVRIIYDMTVLCRP